MPRRSVLYTPGDQPDMLQTAADTAADVLVFDLEDGVAPADRATARRTIRETVPGLAVEGELWVRVNAREQARATDLREVLTDPEVAAAVDGVVVPSVERTEDVTTVAGRLAESDCDQPIHALLETARGVLNAVTIADLPDVDSLAFGAEDLAADVGLRRGEDNEEILYARQRVVTAAAAADVHAIDIIHPAVEDSEGLVAAAEQARAYGYDGKMAIHPAQVDPINEAFTPPSEDVDWARRVVDAAAERDEAVFELEGDLVEPPIVAQAERILDRAGE